MAQAPFVIQPYLTSIVLAYRNLKMIADDVLPRVPVLSEVFKYSLYNKGDAFTVPETQVGRKGKVNEIDWGATEVTSAVNDYGLEDPIPFRDIMNANSVPSTPINPEAHSSELLADLISLDREKRVAALVFADATYPAANKVDLSVSSGVNQWDNFDPTTGSNPIAQITAAMDGMLVRPNTMVLGRQVATKLMQNPRIIKAFNANLGDSGIVPLDFIRVLFGLEKILIGEGWVNSKKKGQTATMVRIWGKSAALLAINPLVQSTVGGVTFGITAEWGTRVAGTRQDPDIGLRGGTRVRVGESVKELVTASDAGYLFENAIA
jgi:hypothetical protein